MKVPSGRAILPVVLTLVFFVVPLSVNPQAPTKGEPTPKSSPGGTSARARSAAAQDFPDGTATPSDLCGACHQAIYREFSEGFGADLQYGQILYEAPTGKKVLGMPAKTSVATLHATAGIEPFPIHSRTTEEESRSCNVCHFPQAFAIPDMNTAEITKPEPRPKQESGSSDSRPSASCPIRSAHSPFISMAASVWSGRRVTWLGSGG